MNHAEKAVEYYSNNFNCSQGVFTTYATEMGMDEKMALMLATNFGGGERKGELCGAVAGALMVLGLRCGHYDSNDMERQIDEIELAIAQAKADNGERYTIKQMEKSRKSLLTRLEN